MRIINLIFIFILAMPTNCLAYITLTGHIGDIGVSLEMKYTDSEDGTLCINNSGNCYDVAINSTNVYGRFPSIFVEVNFKNGDTQEYELLLDKNSVETFLEESRREADMDERFFQEERDLIYKERYY